MRLRPILACLAALGAYGAAASAAQAQIYAPAPGPIGGFMAARDARNGLICLNYDGGLPTRKACRLKTRRHFYEAARAPERPIGPVSWIGPGYAPPTRPAAPPRVAAPSGCGAAGQIAPCGGPYRLGANW